MKIGPVARAVASRPDLEFRLVHTGQHYDERMSKVFFDELGLPRPYVDLGVGSGSHSAQTASVMAAFEPVMRDFAPDLVVVVGDVNSTLAAALVAAKEGIPVAHVEAGLRSFDLTMPEEINRILTDRLSRILFTTEASANENLAREGIPAEHIHFVGNVMIDSLLAFRERARAAEPWTDLGVEPGSYVLVTLHRPSNVDDPETLGALVDAVALAAHDRPVLFPAHPRTRERLSEFGLEARLGAVRVLEPMGYLEFLGLLDQAGLVLTDSGGIQEETTVLGVPCLTLRPNTERPVTISSGTNRLVPPGSGQLPAAMAHALAAPRSAGVRPPLWDGHAGERIAAVIEAFLGTTRETRD